MIIAVSYKDGEIFEHFGHAEMFAFYRTNEDNTEILEKTVVEVTETGHQAVADLMDANGVDVVIVGNIGSGARQALAEYGIVAFAGFCGSADDAAELMMLGQLPYLTDEGNCSGGCGGCGGCGGHDHEDGSCGCGGHDHEDGSCGCGCH